MGFGLSKWVVSGGYCSLGADRSANLASIAFPTELAENVQCVIVHTMDRR